MVMSKLEEGGDGGEPRSDVQNAGHAPRHALAVRRVANAARHAGSA
jgi:hypothetical protein